MPTYTAAEKRIYQQKKRNKAKAKALREARQRKASETADLGVGVGDMFEDMAKRTAREEARQRKASETPDLGVGDMFYEAPAVEEAEPPTGLAYGKLLRNTDLVSNHPDKLLEVEKLILKLQDFKAFPDSEKDFLKAIDTEIIAKTREKTRCWTKLLNGTNYVNDVSLLKTNELEMVEIGARLLEWGATTYSPVSEPHESSPPVPAAEVLAEVQKQMAKRSPPKRAPPTVPPPSV